MKGKSGTVVLLDRSKFLASVLHSATGDAVARAAGAAEEEMRRLITEEGKSGRMYGSHQASAPGEAPANREGALLGSVDKDVDKPGLRGEVSAGGVEAPYLRFLEDGTDMMAPRPLMDPSAEEGAKVLQEEAREIANQLERVI